MDDSDSSSLSSAPDEEVQKLAPIFARAKKATKLKAPPPKESPPRAKRDPSPPHEDAFADNSDIAFLVMFRSRFTEQLPAKLAHLGPQDIERGVIENPPSAPVEALLCSVLALVLNRTKPVEKGHYGRAMEEALLKHKAQWPRRWQGVNPLRGSMDFNSLGPIDRLDILRTLVHWSLSSSDIIRAKIQEAYKQQRHSDDENQGLSVQPWGQDGDKRRYYLIEGQDDTAFRVYREGSRYDLKASPQWYSMAGNIEELRALAAKLENADGTQGARRLSARMLAAIPRFEQSEEKRKKREQRQARRAAFTRPEPGFSLYEGRTRGKRLRYTYDDDEDDTPDSDATTARRSTRQQSNRSTPFEPGPTFTASGRQVRGRSGGMYGESKLSNQVNSTDELAPEYDEQALDNGSEASDPVRGGRRATRNSGKESTNGEIEAIKRKRSNGRNPIDDMSDEDDSTPSGDEWDGGDDNEEDETMADADDKEEDSDVGLEDEDEEEEPTSLVVKLQVNGASSREGSGEEIGSGKRKGNLGEQTPSTNCSVDQGGAAGAQHNSVVNGAQHAQSSDANAANSSAHESVGRQREVEKPSNSMYWEDGRADGIRTGAHTAGADAVGYQ